MEGGKKMQAGTLVLADYPIGYPSGFGETLYNLFRGFSPHNLWTACQGGFKPAKGKELGRYIGLRAPRRPLRWPSRFASFYFPVLKVRQYLASVDAEKHVGSVIDRNAIQHLLIIPVTPWIASAGLKLHRRRPQLNLVVFVMDDWQGHHESYRLPYTRRRRLILRQLIERADSLFAVSNEMAAHYEATTGRIWQVAHNGVVQPHFRETSRPSTVSTKILLAGDVNVFRFDAVLAFAAALERYNNKNQRSPLQLLVLGEVPLEQSLALASYRSVTIRSRATHENSLRAMLDADLLYLPLAFSHVVRRIALYSLPTKLPEYLASGKMVFFHAPEGSATFEIARRYDLRPRVSSINPTELDYEIAEWMSGRIDVDRNASNAQRALREEFDLQTLAKNFQAAFR
jgi:hypothetical protein